ncbi:MAG: TRAP transporter fused permease subunit [Deltaproteobacteria bacterium]|nr:TRAP transporter fused permease subunit [Deltaproteobacteria bacterium]
MDEKSRKSANTFESIAKWSAIGVVLAMVAYHVIIVWKPLFGSQINQNNHLGFCLVLLFLHWAIMDTRKWLKIIYLICIPLSLGLLTFMAMENMRLMMEVGFPENKDIVVGVLLIILVLAGTWKTFGPIFPVMVMVALAYTFWGHLIPGVLNHPKFEFGYVVSNLSTGFQGIYGMLLDASVNLLFLLIIFGSIFEATGVTAFFMELGKWLGRNLIGGAGQTAVFSSSFVGMVNGAAAANVAITGAYTIPVMKKAGFRSETAAAIEAMASTGGQLTPPIMGIAVFIMASFIGVSYGELMFKAVLPAVFYYALAVFGVIIIAAREKIPMGTEQMDKRIFLAGLPVFVVPMGVLTAMLVLHFSIGYSALFGIITILAISMLRRITRPALKVLIRNLVTGAIMAASIGIACGCIGIFIKSLTLSGAMTKLALLVGDISGGHLLPTLFLTMILSIVLSSSMPTVIAYIVVAFVSAPILKDLGLPQQTAHFFVFYFAILAAVTPPIAGAAMVGSQIAGSRYMKVSWESFKLVGPFFILPYFTINNPIVFMEYQQPVQAIAVLITMVIALGAMMCLFQGYCFRSTGRAEKLFLITAAGCAVLFGLYHHPALFAGAALSAAAFLAFQRRKISGKILNAKPA